MGYLFFQTKEVSGAFNRKLNDFKASLGNAVCRGEKITFADNDITYMLKLQHDRLSKKGLELNYDIYSRDDFLRHLSIAPVTFLVENGISFARYVVWRVVLHRECDALTRYPFAFVKTIAIGITLDYGQTVSQFGIESLIQIK